MRTQTIYAAARNMTPEDFSEFLATLRMQSIEKWNKSGAKGFPPGLSLNTIRERIELAEAAGYRLPTDAQLVMALSYYQLIREALAKRVTDDENRKLAR